MFSEAQLLRVAYFINRYPAVSHTFIRREIYALESLGVSVLRIALRSGADLVDDEDIAEKKRTHFILGAGFLEVARCCVVALATQPIAVVSVVWQAFMLGRKSQSGMLRHFAYVAEAIVLGNWCHRFSVQHVHAHFGTNSTTIAMLATRLSGISYSFTAHGPDEFENAPLLSIDKKLKHAKFAVCVSSFGRSQFMRWSPPSLWPKIKVIHCGLDRLFFEKPLTPPPERPRLVCVGRLDERKGQILLVAAARRLIDEGTPCEIVLVGDGIMRSCIEEAVREAGLQKEITIIGWASGERVKAEIESARALVLPSFSENMPVVLMEAMALGRPVISTYIAGIPELVASEKTGWLVPAGAEVALSEAMHKALIAPTKELAVMGLAGRDHIRAQHDAVTEAAKLKSLFE